jgi:glyoxylase-like metal-dependent hydrolase (beta-lactamase superfamily II)
MPDRSRAVMIDSGLKHPDREGILALLEQEHIRVATLLTSHFHPDHVGNHTALKAAHGCSVYMTPFARIMSRDPSNLQAVGYETYTLRKARGPYSYCGPDEIIPEGAEEICVDGITFRLLWLPGHAVEQVGFITPDDVAYLSDTVLSDHVLQAVRLPYYTCLRLDLQTKELLKNLRCRRYILAHNGVCDALCDLIDRNIATAREKLRLVEAQAKDWCTLEQLCAAVMAHLKMDLNAEAKVIGGKRNIQVLVEYLVETERLVFRVREGYVEYRCPEQ